jgi:hypothetical protein
MQVLRSVTWNVSFASDEAAREFDEYIADWQREFSKFGDFEEVRVLIDGMPRYFLGYEYREHLADELRDTIEELTGRPADTDEQYGIAEEAPGPPAIPGGPGVSHLQSQASQKYAAAIAAQKRSARRQKEAREKVIRGQDFF